MIKRIMKALEPSHDKWFDMNDIKVLSMSALACVGGWAIVSVVIALFG